MATPFYFTATALLDAQDNELEAILKKCSKSKTGVYYIPTTEFFDLSVRRRSILVAKLCRLKIDCVIEAVGINPEPVLDSETVKKQLLDVTSARTEMEAGSSMAKEAGHVEKDMNHEVYSPELGQSLFEERLVKEHRIFEAERQAHDHLKQDGCRPAIPLGLLEQAIHNPTLVESHLHPWNNDWCHMASSNSLLLENRSVLQRQRHRWRDFRRWQYYNRLLEYPEDEAIGGYFAARRRFDEAGGLELRQETCSLYVEHVKLAWAQEQALREERTQIWRDKSWLNFAQHACEIQCCLIRHGCEATFAPSEDPMQQTELMTWMEYLCFESLFLEDWTTSAEQLRYRQDDNWMELYLEKFILSNDKPETLISRQVALDKLHQAEEDAEEANEAVDRIKEATDTEPWRSIVSQKEKDALRSRWIEALKAAEIRQRDAREAMGKISDFFKGSEALMEYEKKRDHQQKLVEWILKQIKTIEIETMAYSGSGR